MANGLSMKVLLQLQKRQFEQGISQVKNSLAGLGRTIKNFSGMLLGGLGLSALVGQFKQASTEMSVAKATLENVSKGFKEYSENMAFLKRISNEYGQDLISLTNGFAKFHAAAKETSLSLDQQRYIYEALTRAAGAYHLSAEQTSDVMLAVEQMLSKGKVTAEELRRQLGNSLPGAFNLMAQAAGVSTAELEKMMRAGQVISEDVLPRFAQVLNATTAAANFDSLQSSLNRFKNAWVDFVDKSGFENIFKGFVDMGTKSLNFLSNHFKGLISTVVGGLAGIGTGKVFKSLEQEGSRSILNLRTKTNAFLKEIGQLFKEKQGLVVNYDALDDTKKVEALTKEKALMMGITKEQWAQAKWTDEALRTKSFMVDKSMRQKAIESELVLIDQEVSRLKKEQIKNQVALERSTTSWGRALNGVNAMFKSLWTNIKAIGASFLTGLGIGVVVSLLTAVVQKVVQWAKEQRKIKNLAYDTQAAAEKAASGANEQIGRMEALYKIVTDTDKREELRKRSLKEINNLLGDQKFELEDIKTNSDKVREAIDKWETSLKQAARASAYFSQIQKLEAEKIDLETKRDEEMKKPQSITAGYGIGWSKWEQPTEAGINVANYNKQIKAREVAINHLLTRMEADGRNDPFADKGAFSKKTIDAVKGALDGYTSSVDKLKKKLNEGSISQKKYNRDLNKLREDTTATIQKYDGWEDALESLGPKYEKLYGSLSSVATINQPLENLRKDIDKFKESKDALDRTLEDGAMSGEEYAKALKTLVNRYKDNIIGAEDLEEKLKSLGTKYQNAVKELRDAIVDINILDEIDESIKEQDKILKESMDESIDQLEKYQEKLFKVLDTPFPKRKLRDTTFDYSKSGSEKLEESAGLSDKYVEDLEKSRDMLAEIKQKFGYLNPYLQGLFDKVNNELMQATKNAKELNDAARLAKLIEDINKLKQQRFEDLFNGIAGSGGLGALERLHSSISDVKETFDELNESNDGWEQLGLWLKVLGDIADGIDTVVTAIKTWQTVMETMSALMKAQATLQASTSAQKVTALGAEVAAEGASATATVAAENAKTIAANETSSALAKEAIAGAAASQASLPGVGPVLAATAVAGLIALLMSKMKRFKNGGIVGGNQTSGDNQMVRVNSQEMILTKRDQANLYAAIKSGNLGGKGVDFRIHGSDLVGVIRNYDRRLKG